MFLARFKVPQDHWKTSTTLELARSLREPSEGNQNIVHRAVHKERK